MEAKAKANGNVKAKKKRGGFFFLENVHVLSTHAALHGNGDGDGMGGRLRGAAWELWDEEMGRGASSRVGLG